MIVNFFKLLCVGMWLAGFVLLGMSYRTTGETERLRAGFYINEAGKRVPGVNDKTGEKSPAVINSEKLAHWQMIGGISAIVAGALVGLAANSWGQRRRSRDRSRVGSNPDHLARQFRRRRRSSQTDMQAIE